MLDIRSAPTLLAVDHAGRLQARLQGKFTDAELEYIVALSRRAGASLALGLRYHQISPGGDMTDILIRDVPDDVLAAIDAKAKRVGLSRTEYLRRTLERERVPAAAVSVEQLARTASLAQDLDDPDVMSGAWS